MRHCEECEYMSSTGGEYPETYCKLVSMDDPKVEDDNGYTGCRYNLRTLRKMERDRDEAEYRSLLGYDDFVLVNGIDMTEQDGEKLRKIIGVMMHAIGMWPEGLRHAYKRHGRIYYRPYRNYFSTTPKITGHWMWERMQKAGHAEMRNSWNDGNGEIWSLTRRGLDWLGMKLDMKIYDEED